MKSDALCSLHITHIYSTERVHYEVDSSNSLSYALLHVCTLCILCSLSIQHVMDLIAITSSLLLLASQRTCTSSSSFSFVGHIGYESRAVRPLNKLLNGSSVCDICCCLTYRPSTWYSHHSLNMLIIENPQTKQSILNHLHRFKYN